MSEKFSGKIWLAIVLLIAFILPTIFTGRLLLREKELISAKKLQLAEEKRDLQLLDQILADQKNQLLQMPIVNRTLPADFEEVAFFVSQLEKITKDNNQPGEIKLKEKVTSESQGLSGLGISLTGSGSFNSFAEVLNQLANLPYHTKIDSLKIGKAGTGVNSSLDFRLFLKPEK